MLRSEGCPVHISSRDVVEMLRQFREGGSIESIAYHHGLNERRVKRLIGSHWRWNGLGEPWLPTLSEVERKRIDGL
jgi:hypothetical protein